MLKRILKACRGRVQLGQQQLELKAHGMFVSIKCQVPVVSTPLPSCLDSEIGLQSVAEV